MSEEKNIRRIAKINISNILGVSELEFSPKTVTEITGANGSGKTSIISALKSVIEGGHDATLLRAGAETGEVVLELDDKTIIRKRVTEKGTSITMKGPDGKAIPKAATIVKELADRLSTNPISFLHARKQDRVAIMLETMPLEVDVEEMKKRAGIPIEVDKNAIGLGIVDSTITSIFNERTGTNRAVKEKEATINQLEAAIPPIPEGVSDTTADGEAKLQAQIDEKNAWLEAEKKRINDKMATLQQEAEQKKTELRAELQKKIDELKETCSGRAAKIDNDLAETKDLSAKREAWAISKAAKENEEPMAALAVIKANREAFGRREATMQTVDDMRKQLSGLKKDAVNQSTAIDNLQAFKIEILNNMPIKGLEVRDGDIYLDNVQFDRLNTQTQVDLAIDIALMRVGELQMMCVDGLELMDSKHFDMLLDKLEERGVQAFVTRVTDEKLEIVTSGN